MALHHDSDQYFQIRLETGFVAFYEFQLFMLGRFFPKHNIVAALLKFLANLCLAKHIIFLYVMEHLDLIVPLVAGASFPIHFCCCQL